MSWTWTFFLFCPRRAQFDLGMKLLGSLPREEGGIMLTHIRKLQTNCKKMLVLEKCSHLLMMNVHSCITSCNSCHFDVTAYSTQYICYILTCCFNKIRSVLSFDFLFIPLSFFSFRDMRVKIKNPIFILWKYVEGCIFISSLSKLKMNNLWSC